MALNIVVCIKSVPDSDCYDSITIDPLKKTLVRAGIPTVIGSADKNAVEAALRLKEKHGGSVTVISMGPPEARAQLIEALSWGLSAQMVREKRRRLTLF